MLPMTSIQYENFTHATNLSKQLSSYLLGNRTGEFGAIMEQLRVAIVTVNSTPVDARMVEGLSSWISAAMNHLKEWAGLGALAGLLVLVSLVCLWCICKIRFSQQCNAAMIIQAFMAIEAGQSPHAWLATMKLLRSGCKANHCTWGQPLWAQRRACLIACGLIP